MQSNKLIRRKNNSEDNKETKETIMHLYHERRYEDTKHKNTGLPPAIEEDAVGLKCMCNADYGSNTCSVLFMSQFNKRI